MSRDADVLRGPTEPIYKHRHFLIRFGFLACLLSGKMVSVRLVMT